MRSNFANTFRVEASVEKIVTRLEDMRRIETNAEPLRLAHVLDDVRELLKLITQARALTRGRLERDPGFRLREQGMDGVDRADDLLQAGFLTGAEMGARMED